MKKTLTAALAAILLVTSLTGCNSANEPNNSSDSNISNTPSGSGSSDNNSSDSGSSDNASSDSGSSDNTSDSGSGDNTSDSGSEPEESFPTPAETLEFPDTKSGKMVKAALEYNPEDWSMGLNLDDGQMLPINFPDLTVDMFEDYCFAFDMIGINGHAVFAGKAKAGQEDAVKTALEKNLETYKESVSFYPAGQAAAAGAVSGTSDDGYCYFVIHPNGNDAASAMLAVK